MNLMEIGKNPELQPTETADQTKNSETIRESLTQPLQTPEESPIKLKAERDILATKVSRSERVHANTEKADTDTGRRETDDLIRQAEIARRSSEINRRNSAFDNRTVRNAEAESIASAEQRRLEEQKRIDEQERARAARKKK